MIATTASIMLNDAGYGRLADSEKPHVAAKLAAMQRIDRAENKAAAIRAETLHLIAGRSYSEGAIRKLYYDQWRASGRAWSSLINRARVPARECPLPQAAIDRWHELVFQFRGKHKAAHRSLTRAWQAGQPIPGFEDSDRTPELPRGLSYENLMRPKYRPTKLAGRVASIGLAAAQEFLPGVLTSRVGLAFGSRFVFDDMWHDFKVNVPGQMGARRLLQFHCLELLSACNCARGLKPELLNDRTGRFERLKEREMLFLLAHVLGNIGYNPEGCVLMMEHGTANVSGRVESLLSDLSGGKLTVGRGSISGSPLAPGLYAGQSKGNFKFKAALESWGNLAHNETADRLMFQAQTGSNSRLNAPEELHGQDKHHNQLCQAMLALPPALRDLVRLPATPLVQAIEFVERVQEAINARTEHDIEGWEQCGFVASEYRVHPSHQWSPMTEIAEMPEALRAAAAAAVEQDPRLSRQRKLSPREVFDGLRPTLTRIRAHHVPAILGMENASERRLAKDGRFAFEDQDMGPGDHIYDGLARDEEGHVQRLPAGETFATFVSTLDPVRLHVCDARGRYLGWCERTLVPSKADSHGFARACGRKAREHRELLAPVLAAAAPIMRRQAEDAAANAALFAAAQGAPTELPARPKAQGDKSRTRRAEQLAAAAEAQLSDQTF
jgi:hypothetical protein